MSKFWTQQWDYKYGNCFTFNGGSDKDGKPLRILKASKPGSSYGTKKYMSEIKWLHQEIAAIAFKESLFESINNLSSSLLGSTKVNLQSLTVQPCKDLTKT